MPQATLFAAAMLASTIAAAQPIQLAQIAPPTSGNALDPTMRGVPADPGAATRAVEISAGHQHLSNGYGDWNDVTVVGRYGTGKHLLRAEVSTMRRFGEGGAFLGIGDTYVFNDDWYGSLAIGAGDGAFYLPRLRADGFVSRKLLADRSLVATIGLGYYDAPDGHTDRSLSLAAIYYFTAPWVVEGGVRFNRSNPGSINTRQQYVAATWGRHKQDLVSGRFAWGMEGYQSISEQTQLVNFRSREANLLWRHWFSPRGGLLAGLTYYKNPSYDRAGINLGWFHDF